MSAHKGFFRQSIYELFCGDLKSCLKVSKIKQGMPNGYEFIGGLNFTAALVIMCIIEMMAGFYKDKLQPNSDDVADFMTRYFSKYEPIFNDKEFSKLFYRVYRHGLVHEWSPKASAVAMDFSSQKVLKIIKSGSEELTSVNVPTLYDLTVKALNDYEKDLDNNLFIKEFNNRYNKQIAEDYKQMRLLREKIKKYTGQES